MESHLPSPLPYQPSIGCSLAGRGLLEDVEPIPTKTKTRETLGRTQELGVLKRVSYLKKDGWNVEMSGVWRIVHVCYVDSFCRVH